MKIAYGIGRTPRLSEAWEASARGLLALRGVESVGVVNSMRAGGSREEFPVASFVETFSIDSLALQHWAPQALSAYSAFVAEPGFQHFRFLSLKMLNRYDLTGTFRFIDRELVLQRALLWTIEVIQRRRPDLVIFPVTPHEMEMFVLSEVAQSLGVKVLYFQPSPMAPAMISKSPGQIVKHRHASEKVAPEIKSFLVSSVDTTLATLFDGRPTTYLRAQNRKDRWDGSFFQRLKNLAFSLKWLGSPQFPESVSFSGHQTRNKPLRNATALALTRSLAKSLRESANQVTNIPLAAHYVLFALHYEPERTSLPEGLPLDNQFDAVLRARDMVPIDRQLVVKEHYSQTSPSLRGFAGRSPDFYDLVSRLPNTVLAPPSITSRDLLRGAECVFTLAGTIGIEAAALKVPAAYFGSPWWEGLPGTVKVGAASNYDSVRRVLIAKRGHIKEFLLNLHLTGMIPGTSSETIAMATSRFGELPDSLVAQVAQSIVDIVEENFVNA